MGSRSVGVAMRLGVLGLSGSYTQNEEFATGLAATRQEVGLDVPLFGNGRLSTGYRAASALGPLSQTTVTYMVGYTHSIGSRFNLNVSGELEQREMSAVGREQEYRATAKLGVKF
jgi:hypothetical protein